MNLLPSLPSFNFGGEKPADTVFLREVVGGQIYFFDTATNNVAGAAEVTYQGVTHEVPAPEPAKTFKPELNNNSTVPAKVNYKQVRSVANGALNGAVYHERQNNARADKVRYDYSDVLGDKNVT